VFLGEAAALVLREEALASAKAAEHLDPKVLEVGSLDSQELQATLEGRQEERQEEHQEERQEGGLQWAKSLVAPVISVELPQHLALALWWESSQLEVRLQAGLR
jgi:hypothetical protein